MQIEYHNASRRLWIWISNNPDKGKREWPEWKFNGGHYEEMTNHCFYCKGKHTCDTCQPNIVARELCKNDSKGCMNGLYARYEYAYSFARYKPPEKKSASSGGSKRRWELSEEDVKKAKEEVKRIALQIVAIHDELYCEGE